MNVDLEIAINERIAETEIGRRMLVSERLREITSTNKHTPLHLGTLGSSVGRSSDSVAYKVNTISTASICKVLFAVGFGLVLLLATSILAEGRTDDAATLSMALVVLIICGLVNVTVMAMTTSFRASKF